MANYITSDTDLTAVADAIRAKSGGSGQLSFPSGFVDEIDSISSGGSGDDKLNAFIAGTMAGDVTITTDVVKAYSFYAMGAVYGSGVTVLRLPNCTEIGGNAFDGCTNLRELYIPEYVGNPNWGQPRNGINMFTNCGNLEKIYAPKCKYVPQWLPTGVAKNKIAEITLSPEVSRLGQACFKGTKIEIASFPFVMRMYQQVFQLCDDLTTVDVNLGEWRLENNVFSQSAKFNTFIIRATTMRSLDNVNTFAGTPFADGGAGGTLYVPSALVSSYQSATNWSTVLGYTNNQILPIEGSYYETHYADGTLIA